MLDTSNILLSITAVFNIALAIFVSRKKQESTTSFYFGLFAIFLALWAVALIGYSLVSNTTIALYLLKASYIAALMIGVSFYFFSYTYPTNRTPSRIHTYSVYISVLLFTAPLLIFDDFFTKNIVEHTWGKETILGIPEYLFFSLLFSYLFVGGLIRTWIKTFKSNGLQKIQLLLIATSVTFAGILGMYFNLYLPSPYIQDFRFIWSGPLFTFVIAIAIGYSIFRLKLFDIRLASAELLTFSLWIFLLIQILIADDIERQIIDTVLLLFTTIIGIYLIKSINKEIDTREALQKANAQLRELDRQKSEFLSIATHQLRGPLAGIRGHLSLILDGSYGVIPKKVSPIIEKLFTSSGLLAQTINDFLSVSRIEQGRMQYNMADVDCVALITDVVEELKPIARDRGLTLEWDTPTVTLPTLTADYAKIRHVFFNLIDNAIKYTKEGWIRIKIEQVGLKTLRVTVSDSGVGISKDEIPALFEKFVRARDAAGINISGTGLGLYVAREMVQAHKGKIWVESDGKEKGSQFIVELPITTNGHKK